MLALSDIHFALEPLRRVVETGETLLILGDLVNLTDYRTGEGAVADVLGMEFARASASARGAGDYQRMRGLWLEKVGDRVDEIRAAIGEAIDAQYDKVSEALHGGHGYVIHGNVDRPGSLERSLPNGYEYVHGETRDIDGIRVGFVGGGASTPLQAEGEVPDDEMSRLLGRTGPGRCSVHSCPSRLGSSADRCGDRPSRARLDAPSRLHPNPPAPSPSLRRRPSATGEQLAGRGHPLPQCRVFPGDATASGPRSG